MRKHTIYIVAVAVAALFWGCEGSPLDFFTSGDLLKAQQSVTVPGDASTAGEFDIEADCEWTITKHADWITLSRSTGNGSATINVTCQVNPTTSERTDTLVVASRSNTIIHKVVVTQGSGEAQLSVVKNDEAVSTLQFQNYASTDRNVQILCNQDLAWTVKSSEDWLKVSPASGTGPEFLEISVSENIGGSREAVFSVADPYNNLVNVRVVQSEYASSISVEPATQRLESGNPATVRVQVSSSDPWVLSGTSLTAGDSKLSAESGESGQTDIDITVDKNNSNRDREIVFTLTNQPKDENTKKSCTITIIQPGSDYYLTASVGAIDFEAGGSQKTVTVASNSDWTIESIPAWISYTRTEKVEGNDAVDVTFTAAKNMITNSREGVIKIATSFNSVEINVSQAAHVPSLEAIADIDFGEDGGEQRFAVNSTDPWTISGGADWLSIDKTSGQGTGNEEVRLTAAMNREPSTRTATLTVSTSYHTATVLVTQQSYNVNLEVSTDPIALPALGGEGNIVVTSNETWTVSVDNSWLRAEKSENRVVVTADYNPTTDQREARVVVALQSGLIQRTVDVTQAPGSLAQVDAPTVSDLGKYGFKLGSVYTSETPVVEYGFCLSDAVSNPTVEHKIWSATGSQTTGSMTYEVTGLESAKVYYVRAYAINGITGKVSYSQSVSQKTGGTTPSGDDNNPPATN